jgi:hypothetical protein
MKTFLKFYLAAICLSISGNLFSQNFISENKVWSIVSEGGMEQPWIRTISCKFSGDTTVQQTHYKKLYISEDEQKMDWKLNSLWLERNDSIFKYWPWTSETKLVYDFNITEKDSFRIDEFLTLYVDSVRVKEWGGKMRKHWYFVGVEHYSSKTTLWIEGVGNKNNFTRSSEVGITGGTSSILCFEENDQLVYQNPQYNDCYINSSVSAQNISITDSLNRWNIGLNCVSEEPIDPYNRWSTYFEHIEGDTIINEMHYKRLVHCLDSMCVNKSFKSFIREDSGKVFLADKTREFILYDFNLKQGDSLVMYYLWDERNSNPLFIQVDSVKSGIFQDQKERIIQYVTVYAYHYRESSFNDVIVEGIGSMRFGLEYPINLFLTGATGCNPNLLCFYTDKNLVYTNPEFNDCYITTGISQFHKTPELVKVISAPNGMLVLELTSSVSGKIFIFNLLGEIVSQKKILDSTSQLYVPGTGIYLYRFVSDDGQIQTGKTFIH